MKFCKKEAQQQTYTLEEIALAICNHYCEIGDGCNEDCVGFCDCWKNHNGALAWLREVVNRT